MPIIGVLAPHSVHTILKELADGPFSISIDSSNHKTTKLFPLVLRYFHSKKGIQVRLLDLEELGGETAAEVQNYFWQSFLLPIKIITLQIYEWILKILQRHKLKFEALTSFCADNCNTNFGGMDHGGDKNIFHKLKTHKGNLIAVGCPSHILHNAAKFGADNLPFDIESIVFKLASHFRNSTKRIEHLKDIFEEFEVV